MRLSVCSALNTPSTRCLQTVPVAFVQAQNMHVPAHTFVSGAVSHCEQIGSVGERSWTRVRAQAPVSSIRRVRPCCPWGSSAPVCTCQRTHAMWQAIALQGSPAFPAITVPPVAQLPTHLHERKPRMATGEVRIFKLVPSPIWPTMFPPHAMMGTSVPYVNTIV